MTAAVLTFLALLGTYANLGLAVAAQLDYVRPRTPARHLVIAGVLWPLTLVVLALRALQIEWRIARDVLGLRKKRSGKAK